MLSREERAEILARERGQLGVDAVRLARREAHAKFHAQHPRKVDVLATYSNIAPYEATEELLLDR